MAQKFTNVETYLIILFLFAIVVTAIIHLGNELLANDNSELDNDSISYITNLRGIDMSEFNVSKEEVEASISILGNESQGNPKDEALEFLYAKQKGFNIETKIKMIFSLPQFILIDLLRFSLNDWRWVIFIFNWLYRLLITIAIVYFIRGIVRS